MAAAVPIIKVVGVALSAKAAYDGIKEGNFFQAVVGAVGAYYGISSLATPATAAGASGVTATAEGAAQTAATAGADTATKVASQAAAKGMEGAAQAAGTEALSGAARDSLIESLKVSGDQLAKRGGAEGFSGLLSRAGEGIQKGADWIDRKGFEPIREAVTGGEGKYLTDGTLNPTASNVGQGRGLLKWGKDNPDIVSTGAKLVGGYMEGKAEEDLIKRQERLIAERYDRMGSPVDISRAGGIRWNPETRRFSQEIA